MAAGSAAAFPSECIVLIIESAQAFVEDRTLAGICQAQREFATPGRIERLRKYHGDKAEWVLDAWIGTWLAPSFAAWTLDATFRVVTCPVLAIHGDGDEYGSVRHPQRIAASAGVNVPCEILADCGHVPYREKSRMVLDLVCEWLADIAD